MTEQTNIPALEHVDTRSASLKSAIRQILIATFFIGDYLFSQPEGLDARMVGIRLACLALAMTAVYFIVRLSIWPSGWWETSPEGLTKRGFRVRIVPWSELEHISIQKVDYMRRPDQDHLKKQLIITAKGSDWEITFSHHQKDTIIPATQISFAASVAYHIEQQGIEARAITPEEVLAATVAPDQSPVQEMDWTVTEPAKWGGIKWIAIAAIVFACLAGHSLYEIAKELVTTHQVKHSFFWPGINLYFAVQFVSDVCKARFTAKSFSIRGDEFTADTTAGTFTYKWDDIQDAYLVGDKYLGKDIRSQAGIPVPSRVALQLDLGHRRIVILPWIPDDPNSVELFQRVYRRLSQLPTFIRPVFPVDKEAEENQSTTNRKLNTEL